MVIFYRVIYGTGDPVVRQQVAIFSSHIRLVRYTGCPVYKYKESFCVYIDCMRDWKQDCVICLFRALKKPNFTFQKIILPDCLPTSAALKSCGEGGS